MDRLCYTCRRCKVQTAPTCRRTAQTAREETGWRQCRRRSDISWELCLGKAPIAPEHRTHPRSSLQALRRNQPLPDRDQTWRSQPALTVRDDARHTSSVSASSESGADRGARWWLRWPRCGKMLRPRRRRSLRRSERGHRSVQTCSRLRCAPLAAVSHDSGCGAYLAQALTYQEHDTAAGAATSTHGRRRLPTSGRCRTFKLPVACVTSSAGSGSHQWQGIAGPPDIWSRISRPSALTEPRWTIQAALDDAMAALAELEADDTAQRVLEEAARQAELLQQLQGDLAAARQRQASPFKCMDRSILTADRRR